MHQERSLGKTKNTENTIYCDYLFLEKYVIPLSGRFSISIYQRQAKAEDRKRDEKISEENTHWFKTNISNMDKNDWIEKKLHKQMFQMSLVRCSKVIVCAGCERRAEVTKHTRCCGMRKFIVI